MTAAYFEDHPTDPEKVILRKPSLEQAFAEFAKQFGEYKAPDNSRWVGLTDEEIKAFDTWHDNREEEIGWVNPSEIVAYIEAKLKEKNT
jgi:hypothetical protein